MTAIGFELVRRNARILLDRLADDEPRIPSERIKLIFLLLTGYFLTFVAKYRTRKFSDQKKYNETYWLNLQQFRFQHYVVLSCTKVLITFRCWFLIYSLRWLVQRLLRISNLLLVTPLSILRYPI